MKRYVLRTVLKCHTAFQAGTLEQVPTTDKRTARDGLGRLFLPGTAYAGVLRALLRISCGEKPERELFGYQEGESGQRSALLVDHGYVLGEIAPNVRDFVRIDRRWGTAEERKKFDWEVLPAGTEISLRLEYIDYEKRREGSESSFLKLVKFLHDRQEWQIGAGCARGIGRISADNSRFALWCFTFPNAKNAADYFALLRAESDQDTWQVVPKNCAMPINSENLQNLLQGRDAIATAHSIDLELEADGPFLIGAGENGDEWDIVPYRENGKCIAPGSSFRGAMRQRAERIVNTLLCAKGYRPIPYDISGKNNCWARVGEAFVAPLFGSVDRASFVSVFDSELPERNLQPVQSVTIDRFTGGAREGRLFSSEVFWSRKKPLRFTLHLTLRPGLKVEEKNGLYGLLAHVLYDLGTGDLLVGRAKTSGHGTFRVRRLEISGIDPYPIKIGKGCDLDFTEAKEKYRERLQKYQGAFLAWLKKQANVLHDPENDKQLMLETVQKPSRERCQEAK